MFELNSLANCNIKFKHTLQIFLLTYSSFDFLGVFKSYYLKDNSVKYFDSLLCFVGLESVENMSFIYEPNNNYTLYTSI